jgi:hypothetical protein
METACLEVKTMDFEPKKCAHPAPLGAQRVRARKSLPLTDAKNNNNNNKNVQKNN